jgi:hypothetical protein
VSSSPLQHHNNKTTCHVGHGVCARGLWDPRTKFAFWHLVHLAVTPVTLQSADASKNWLWTNVKWGPIMEEARKPEPSMPFRP